MVIITGQLLLSLGIIGKITRENNQTKNMKWYNYIQSFPDGIEITHARATFWSRAFRNVKWKTEKQYKCYIIILYCVTVYIVI